MQAMIIAHNVSKNNYFEHFFSSGGTRLLAIDSRISFIFARWQNSIVLSTSTNAESLASDANYYLRSCLLWVLMCGHSCMISCLWHEAWTKDLPDSGHQDIRRIACFQRCALRTDLVLLLQAWVQDILSGEGATDVAYQSKK